MSTQGAAPRGYSNLQIRVMSAVVLAAIVLVVTWYGGVAFRLLATLIALAIFYEWSTMAATPRNGASMGLFAALVGVPMLAAVLGYPAETVILLGVAATAIGFAFGIASGEKRESAVIVAYALASGISLAFLRAGDTSGLQAILYLFAVVWSTDILAYFVGRAIGGPKLAPAISPGKTWSGAFGGALGGVLGGLAVALSTGADALWLSVIALLLSVVAQIGDLFESGVKRRHGVKDSGSLIPGHGGVMDRVDGLVAAAFALYLIGAAAGRIETPAHGLFPT